MARVDTLGSSSEDPNVLAELKRLAERPVTKTDKNGTAERTNDTTEATEQKVKAVLEQ